MPDSVLYVDLPGHITPSVISGNSLRSDLLLTVSSKCLYILELTVGFEAKHQYGSVKFISLPISTLGVFSFHLSDILNMLKETGHHKDANNNSNSNDILCVLQKRKRLGQSRAAIYLIRSYTL